MRASKRDCKHERANGTNTCTCVWIDLLVGCRVHLVRVPHEVHVVGGDDELAFMVFHHIPVCTANEWVYASTGETL